MNSCLCYAMLRRVWSRPFALTACPPACGHMYHLLYKLSNSFQLFFSPIISQPSNQHSVSQSASQSTSQPVSRQSSHSRQTYFPSPAIQSVLLKSRGLTVFFLFHFGHPLRPPLLRIQGGHLGTYAVTRRICGPAFLDPAGRERAARGAQPAANQPGELRHQTRGTQGLLLG